MTQFTYFSRHAFARARQRTLLSSAEIADILNRQIFVDTGGIPGFNRRHLLFYSARDEAYFVAIQDRHSGTVVTILPLDYHKTLAWEITDAECQKARELCLTAYQTTSAIQATPQYSSSPVVASVFLISVHFMSPDGKPKTKSLLKIPSASY